MCKLLLTCISLLSSKTSSVKEDFFFPTQEIYNVIQNFSVVLNIMISVQHGE